MREKLIINTIISLMNIGSRLDACHKDDESKIKKFLLLGIEFYNGTLILLTVYIAIAIGVDPL